MQKLTRDLFDCLVRGSGGVKRFSVVGVKEMGMEVGVLYFMEQER